MTHPITSGIGVHIGRQDVKVRADDPGDGVRVAPGHRFEFAGRKRRRVQGDAAFGAAKGHVEQGALPGHQRGQSPNLVEVGVGVIAQAALEWPPCAVVLDPITPKRQDGPVVGVDRHLDVDLAVGLGHQNPYVILDVEQRRGVFDVGVDRVGRRRQPYL